MATKKTNISELKQQCMEAEKNFKLLREQLEAAKKEEEAEKKAKLEAEKHKRYDEVIAAYDKFNELKTAYVHDYGCFILDAKNSNSENLEWFWKSLGLL